MILVIFIALIVLASALYLFFAFAPQIGAKPDKHLLRRLKNGDLYFEKQFHNLVPTSLNMSFNTLVRSMYEFLKGGKSRQPSMPIRTCKFDRDAFSNAGNGSEAAIVWFGHSTLLVKLHGIVILTDPVLAGERASMFSFMGPKRFPYTNRIEIRELPIVDLVLLSHDHYDHLDYPTILALKHHTKKFIVPFGVKAHLTKWGIDPLSITEHEWWDHIVFNESLMLDCVPARHFSGRAITGRNSTLWCSWIISGSRQRIYFGADSGYSPTFKDLGNRFGPFDLNLLECGAYSKYWPDIHMMPEETLQAHLDLKGRYLMPIHWGKFSLSLHGWKEPVERLQQGAAVKGVHLTTPEIGQVLILSENLQTQDWWRAYQ